MGRCPKPHSCRELGLHPKPPCITDSDLGYPQTMLHNFSYFPHPFPHCRALLSCHSTQYFAKHPQTLYTMKHIINYIFPYFSNVCEALEHHFAPCFPRTTIRTATGLVTDSSVFSVYLHQFSSVSHQVFCDGLVLTSSLFVIIGATHDSGLQCPLVCLCHTKLYSHRT